MNLDIKKVGQFWAKSIDTAEITGGGEVYWVILGSMYLCPVFVYVYRVH